MRQVMKRKIKLNVLKKMSSLALHYKEFNKHKTIDMKYNEVHVEYCSSFKI